MLSNIFRGNIVIVIGAECEEGLGGVYAGRAIDWYTKQWHCNRLAFDMHTLVHTLYLEARKNSNTKIYFWYETSIED